MAKTKRRKVRRAKAQQRPQQQIAAGASSMDPRMARLSRRLLGYNVALFLGLMVNAYTAVAHFGDRMTELNHITGALTPLLYAAVLAYFFLTRWWVQSVDAVRDDPSERNLAIASRAVMAKLVFSTLCFGIVIYPLVVVSGIGARITHAIVEIFWGSVVVIAPRAQALIDWVVAGIAGWIANIVLGAMGSGLWEWIRDQRGKHIKAPVGAAQRRRQRA